MFKFNLKNKDIHKEINITTNLNGWEEYRHSMKTFQLKINEYLTQLVDDEKSGDFVEIDEDSEESETEDDSNTKRKLDPPDNNNKRKIKKI